MLLNRFTGTTCVILSPIALKCVQLKNSAKREINDSIMAGGGAVKAKLLEMNTQGGGKPPKILYCSRTHSQIQQVVQEMRKTKYNRTSYALHSKTLTFCFQGHNISSAGWAGVLYAMGNHVLFYSLH